MLTRLTFKKQERLCSRKIIDSLFTGGGVSSAFCFPLKAVWRVCALPENVPAQILFVVSKKNFKKAHDRNRIRRRLKEIYRLNKSNFFLPLAEKKLQLAVVVMYTSKEELDYSQLQQPLINLLNKILESAQQNPQLPAPTAD
ncbi:MAG: ribonuclease P protein component [Bacteroidetes bacterium]|nr:ribonuclease P protein component [Bacteroidota bacterium]